MFRLARMLALVGAAVLIVAGSLLPWATWKNLYGKGINGWWALAGHEHDPIVVADGFGATGGFAITAITYQQDGDGVANQRVVIEHGTNLQDSVRILGPKGSGQTKRTLFANSGEEQPNILTKSGPIADQTSVESPHGSFRSSPGLDLLVYPLGLLVCLAALPRSKPLVTIMALPAAAWGVFPMIALRQFVSDASKLQEYDLALDPALGVGIYTMLLGAVLAGAGAVIVWLEPARLPGVPAPREVAGQPRRLSPSSTKTLVRIVGVILILGALVCFWKSREPFHAREIYATEADDIERQLQTNQWGRGEEAGKHLVETGRAAAEHQGKMAWMWVGGGVGALLVGGLLVVAPRFRKQPTS